MDTPMTKKNLGQRAGFTLIEVVMALGVIAVAVAISAQGLASTYYLVNLQSQRYEAMCHCQSAVSMIRQDRSSLAQGEFPSELKARWLEDVDQTEKVVSAEQRLPDEEIYVTFTTEDGTALQATVVAQWRDIQGRIMRERLVTLIGSR